MVAKQTSRLLTWFNICSAQSQSLVASYLYYLKVSRSRNKILKLEIEIQVSSISKSSEKKNKFIRLFFGRSYSSTILFWDLLTFRKYMRNSQNNQGGKFDLVIAYHITAFWLVSHSKLNLSLQTDATREPDFPKWFY